ncbi:hypothetical protein [Phenylobacterium sp.]|uniref:hypothetical protein n=1 Tax=Phenylobacterium sp. TaxID=1871053 RepID=UPI002DF104FF|nr:hypothetical protein [Phenylobacterium sp.]
MTDLSVAAASPPEPSLQRLSPGHAGGEVARALLQVGFDDARYRQDYPDLAKLGPEVAAWHYHVAGRAEGRRAHFRLPWRVAEAKAQVLSLPAQEERLLRQDIALARLGEADVYGRDLEAFGELSRPHELWRPLVIVSDSHGQFYLAQEVLRRADLLPVPFLNTGASARGLMNPNSRGGHGSRILQMLEARGERLAHATVLFKFGQVDLEFVYDFQRIHSGQTAFDLAAASDFARESARRYAEFLRQARAATSARIVVSSALPPTLSDAALRQGVVNGHIAHLHAEADIEALAAGLARLDMPDQPTRTGLARTFNTTLQSACAELGLAFLDDFNPLLGPEGVIAPELIAWHGGSDHHIPWLCPDSRRAAGELALRIASL